MALIIESQNHTEIFRRQGTSRGLQSNLLLTAGLTLKLQHVAQGLVQGTSERLQGRGLLGISWHLFQC